MNMFNTQYQLQTRNCNDLVSKQIFINMYTQCRLQTGHCYLVSKRDFINMFMHIVNSKLGIVISYQNVISFLRSLIWLGRDCL